MPGHEFILGAQTIGLFEVPEFDQEADPGLVAFFPTEFAKATAPRGPSLSARSLGRLRPGATVGKVTSVGATDVAGYSWVLWALCWDDNWERWEWRVLAATDQTFHDRKGVASFMLRSLWEWQHVNWQTGMCDELERGGLLDVIEIERIGRETLGRG